MNEINEGNGSSDFFAGVPGFMQVFIVGFIIVFVLIVAFTGLSLVRNWRALRKAGVDPLAVQGQIAGQLANSELLAGRQTIEERLRELDDLHARGVISEDEYRAARSAALTDN